MAMDDHSLTLNESPYMEFHPNPILDPLIENWTTIRDELWDLCIIDHKRDETGWLHTDLGDKINGVTSNFGDQLYHGRFKGFSLYIRDTLSDEREKRAMRWSPDEKERWWPMRCAVMPWITEYTKVHNDVIGSVTFNTSYPGSILNHHWGLDTRYLRLHLCLEEADGCVFNIEGWERTWRDGEIFGFDDANVLHGTSHSGTKPRTIMLIDILKDTLRPFAKTWPIRDSRPHRDHWPLIKTHCGQLRQG